MMSAETNEIQRLLREMANFIALYETIEEKIVARESAIENKILLTEKVVNHQLNIINASLADFEGLMTEAGATRWETTAQNILNQGQAHLAILRAISNDVSKTLQENINQLHQASIQANDNISFATKTFRTDEFKQTTTESCHKIKTAANSAIRTLVSLVRNFHWKNITMLFTLTLMVITTTGLYINAEWPWEIHQDVVNERKAGKILLNAWPYLNAAQQQNINNIAKRHGLAF